MGIWRSRDTGSSLGDIERAYRRRFSEYQRVATAIIGDSDSARDAVQDAFASAVRKRESFRGEGPLDAWLWRTVVNTAQNHRRAIPRQMTQFEPKNGDGPHDPDDHGGDLRLALSLLPGRQRLALFLRYYADLDYATIATVLRVSEGTVAATLHTAHQALRRRFEEVRS